MQRPHRRADLPRAVRLHPVAIPVAAQQAGYVTDRPGHLRVVQSLLRQRRHQPLQHVPGRAELRDGVLRDPLGGHEPRAPTAVGVLHLQSVSLIVGDELLGPEILPVDRLPATDTLGNRAAKPQQSGRSAVGRGQDRPLDLDSDDPVDRPLLAQAVLPDRFVDVVGQADQLHRQIVVGAATELLVLDQVGRGADLLADAHRVVGLHSCQRQRGQQLRRLLLNPVTDPRGDSVVGDHQRCETAAGIVPAKARDPVELLPRSAVAQDLRGTSEGQAGVHDLGGRVLLGTERPLAMKRQDPADPIAEHGLGLGQFAPRFRLGHGRHVRFERLPGPVVVFAAVVFAAVVFAAVVFAAIVFAAVGVIGRWFLGGIGRCLL